MHFHYLNKINLDILCIYINCSCCHLITLFIVWNHEPQVWNLKLHKSSTRLHGQGWESMVLSFHKAIILKFFNFMSFMLYSFIAQWGNVPNNLQKLFFNLFLFFSLPNTVIQTCNHFFILCVFNNIHYMPE